MLINKQLLDTVSAQAKDSPRLRMNYNFHDSLDAKAQRLLNAVEPGTELVIHRHSETAEPYILLRGALKMIFYNDEKEITDQFVLAPKNGEYGIQIPKGQWPTIEVLEKDTVIFEVKDGPYRPLGGNDVLS